MLSSPAAIVMDWHDEGNCTNYDFKTSPDYFFPEDRNNEALFNKGARNICFANGSCPVRELCLGYAIVHDEKGFWGGMSQRERSKMKPMLKLKVIRRYQQLYRQRHAARLGL